VAFSLWYKENKERIRSEFVPDVQAAKGDFLKRSRALFKSLPDAERSIFIRRAREKIVARRPKDDEDAERPKVQSTKKASKNKQLESGDETDVLLGVKKTLTEDFEEMEEGELPMVKVEEDEVTNDFDGMEAHYVEPVNESREMYMVDTDVAKVCIFENHGNVDEQTLVNEADLAKKTIHRITDDFAKALADTGILVEKAIENVPEDKAMEEDEEERDVIANTSIVEEDNAGDYIFESSFDSNTGFED